MKKEKFNVEKKVIEKTGTVIYNLKEKDNPDTSNDVNIDFDFYNKIINNILDIRNIESSIEVQYGDYDPEYNQKYDDSIRKKVDEINRFKRAVTGASVILDFMVAKNIDNINFIDIDSFFKTLESMLYVDRDMMILILHTNFNLKYFRENPSDNMITNFVMNYFNENK